METGRCSRVSESGRAVEFIYDADIYKVHLLSSWDGAAVVLDVLTLKAAIDGQLDPAYQLYSPHLLSLPVKELRSLVVALGNSELRKIIFPRLVQQLQTCIMEAASFRLGQGSLAATLSLVSFDLNYDSLAQLVTLAYPDPAPYTALHNAAAVGHTAVCEVLLKLPNAATAPDAAGMIPLHMAAEKGRTAIVSMFLGKAPQSATAASTDGKLPLHIAAESEGGHAKIAQLLLDSAPQAAMAAAENSKLPLHLACKGGDLATCQLLLDRAPQAVTAADALGRLPLHWAAHEGHADVCQLLLDTAPLAASTSAEGGILPLHLAAMSGNVASIKLLLATAPHTATQATHTGDTPLMCALEAEEDWGPHTWMRRLDAARCFLAAGPAAAVQAVLVAAGRAALPLSADFVMTRLPLPAMDWQGVPAACPGLIRALPSALAHSTEQAGWLVQCLPTADAQRLRIALLSLHRAQRQQHVFLPSPIVYDILALICAY
ncbi:hypothetical protein D9Q98_005837 [Chlorella vulgaris]|uniref:Uncharacterized protein n=1 Tax=Chlorella vulgaris TaxID=3077 RepID=A0A9D4TWC3_CHLVU|nr:hypothetical protein D9Q98_005837 [Chlorella vulgaris]